MGNYESLRTSATIQDELTVTDEQSFKDQIKSMDTCLDRALDADLKEAAALTDVHNSYVLTWLDRRDSE